jgi:hypothetical protein
MIQDVRCMGTFPGKRLAGLLTYLVHCSAARGPLGDAEPKPIGHTAPSLLELAAGSVEPPKP